MSKMAHGHMLYSFEDLSVPVDEHEYYFKGKVWIEYSAYYDREKRLWDIDYHFDDIKELDLEYPDESIEDLPKQERVQSAVLRALDDDHYSIKEWIIDDVRNWN